MAVKILLIPDVPNWALDKNAKDIIKYNNSGIEFNIAYFSDFKNELNKFYNEYDLLFPMYINLFFKIQKINFPLDKVITGIRSFVLWDKGRTVPPGYNVKPPYSVVKRLRKALLVNTNCKKLWYIFSHCLPVIHTKYTCDLEVYFPEKKSRGSDKLIIGWSGSLTNHGHIRGFFDIIVPVCKTVNGVKLLVQNSEKKWITDNNKMREFYNSLDLYICASSSESGPRPVLEASACGVPILTTDVGIIPELIDNNINGFIVDRNRDAFVNKLKNIVNNRDRLPEMGRAARKKMENEFNWNHLIHQWIDFFNYSIELYKLKQAGGIRT